ncbi:SAM-dependent DNA methyltransferase [Aeromicrobium tamlense]|uniref:site-specific DNA-methyltransferase (adenine-specific) n=1 Tax=Aeromicrobium tamlense TaxID=375541 RepID=A0A8I0FU75_9ACTN|nr:class I SAM-dependent DNA methyltransferase [Aeromicrobium tamlense]MBD1268976.1 SAM-dependent DNA methyltransferase [Aeromicrobium tamlense]NYI37116.1 type I restriction enzyme M protein [Aeromicrobium tamlense]
MSSLGTFVWGIADQLRGPYKPHQYGDVILPMTILRRLDAILEPTRDEVRELVAANPSPEIAAARIKQQLGLGFFNTSKWTFAKLLGDPEGLAANLVDYLSGFSANIDVFERFKFEQTIHELADKDRLLIVVQAFAKIDLSPTVIDNAAMGDLFEELIRKFADASNETAGEHFTPRDAIRLLVDLLFAGDNDALAGEGVVRTVYDPTAGTGGMLSIADEHLRSQNPDARLRLYGQEINDQSYAICKSDMIAKGQDAQNIKLGDTLASDKFAGTTFDYCLSNPPYGVDWKASQAAIKAEVQNLGVASRFHAGLPAVSDGQMLFLQHLVAKMRPVKQGGGRAGIVLNGSPLFNGGAGSGPSEIRRWLLESDKVDAIVALPTEMFYNTGIATYVWILDNDKPRERVGKVQLIDGTDFFTKMRKSLGSKRREISPEQREELVHLYADYSETEHSKIFSTDEFGYWTITVERPLLDEDGLPATDRKGSPRPDSKLRDTENVPFTYGGNTMGADGRDATIKAYVEAEVLPHVPEAWLDEKKTKVGYEIAFTRHFYTYVPPRPLAAIDADLEKQVAKILELLREVEA